VDFEIIVTHTEKESLILEINLIKEHRPRFNILFMDDKSYPYLKLNKTGIPNVTVSRDRKHKSNFYYFGPYPNAKAARKMADLLNEILPSESGFLPNKQKIYAKFNRTELKFTEEEINAWRQSLIRVLKGYDTDFKDALIDKMNTASMNLNFEVAQGYKERLEALDYVSDRQQVQFNRNETFDMFNYATHQSYIAIVGLFVRNGKLIEKTMAVTSTLEAFEDAFVSFIAQFYEHQPLPKEVFIPQDIPLTTLDTLLETQVKHSFRGKKFQLMEIGKRNANLKLEDQFEILLNREVKLQKGLDQLASLLNIPVPHRIEIFDNAHISGAFAVSACVVFDDGMPNKDMYRRYRLSTGADDVASMQEVLYRRYFRLLKEDKVFPDLIVVDGGITQLNAAKGVIRDLELAIPVIGLVKDAFHRTRGILLEDENEIGLSPQDEVYPLLVNMQEEVHRFVVSYHRQLRKKSMTRSILEEVEGLGAVGRKKLYNKFGSLKRMREASLEELATVIPLKVAENLQMLLNLEWNNEHEKN
ncbi:MAG TPA: excinuclease ABC subunit UvrC, partial [Erysipelothrix sp.]|nr:excinuclease ABC subunit UvrC [Erysipelothrix sp.]